MSVSADKAKTIVAGAANFAVGAYANGVAHIYGKIDDASFWKKALTAEERALWRTSTYPF